MLDFLNNEIIKKLIYLGVLLFVLYTVYKTYNTLVQAKYIEQKFNSIHSNTNSPKQCIKETSNNSQLTTYIIKNNNERISSIEERDSIREIFKKNGIDYNYVYFDNNDPNIYNSSSSNILELNLKINGTNLKNSILKLFGKTPNNTPYIDVSKIDYHQIKSISESSNIKTTVISPFNTPSVTPPLIEEIEESS